VGFKGKLKLSRGRLSCLIIELTISPSNYFVPFGHPCKATSNNLFNIWIAELFNFAVQPLKGFLEVALPKTKVRTERKIAFKSAKQSL